jgi:RimJ/RimL family protein N-acetyltransferase
LPPDPIPFPDPPLRDGVVMLRPWRLADLPAVLAAMIDPEIARYSPVIAYPYEEADFLGWFHSQEPERLTGAGVDFAVITDPAAGAPGRLLGAVGLGAVNRLLRSASTGYWLAADARGHGYISRALRLLATWAFDELGFERLELTNDPENLPSQRVAARCGFTLEGTLRSHMVIRATGQRRDSLVWGLLPGELA